MLGCLVNVQLDLTMLSRNKQTGILPWWIYGTCAVHINNNCQERVEVGISQYLCLNIHTSIDKPQFENLLDFWKSPPFNVLSKTSVYVWMGSQSVEEKNCIFKNNYIRVDGASALVLGLISPSSFSHANAPTRLILIKPVYINVRKATVKEQAYIICAC